MKRLLCLICALSLLLLTACTPADKSSGTPVTDHKWKSEQNWAVTQTENGVQSVSIDAAGEATAWYDAALPENFTITTELKLLSGKGDTDCARVIFRDASGNPCLTVTVEYVGTAHVQLRVDAFTNTGETDAIHGWKNLFIAEKWSKISDEDDLTLVICRTDADAFTVCLLQKGADLVSETAVSLDQRYLELVHQAGVGTYDSHVRFTSFAIHE